MKIVKHKRTKRLRPYSGGDTTYFPIALPELKISDDKSMSTEEEEDMANCLIQLAQGFCRKLEREIEEEKGDSMGEKIINKKRRLIGIDSVATGKTSVDTYECKTCNRMFQSFQALGGHRASHKKLRADQKLEDKEVKAEEVKGQLWNLAPPQQIHVVTVKPDLSPLVIKVSKVHECSVCRSEFSSGQALGGHMRRHRVALPVKAPSKAEEESSNPKTIHIFSFDLNLPAPVDDDQNQEPKNILVFKGPVSVGCHY